MLSQMKWVRTGMTTLMVMALLCGSTLAKKPPKDPPPEPDPPPVTYTITWVDFGVGNHEVMAIDDHGAIVGYVQSSGLYEDDIYSSSSFAYVYTPETGVVDLNTLLPEGSGWYLQFARDINNSGQIVGSGRRYGDDRRRTFLYTPALLAEDGSEIEPAKIEEPYPLSAGDQEAPSGIINEHGEVLGRIRDANGVDHIYLFKDGLAVPVLSSTDGPGLSARGINDSGQALIYSDDFSMIRLQLPFGEPECFSDMECWDINNSGEFVGFKLFEVPVNRNKTKTVMRAIRHDGFAALDLGAGDGSGAHGINNHGDIAGSLAYSESMTFNGFVYLEEFEQFVPLDDAIVGDPIDVECWLLPGVNTRPEAINDAGQIAGTLSMSGLYYSDPITIGFVLTPVP